MYPAHPVPTCTPLSTSRIPKNTREGVYSAVSQKGLSSNAFICPSRPYALHPCDLSPCQHSSQPHCNTCCTADCCAALKYATQCWKAVGSRDEKTRSCAASSAAKSQFVTTSCLKSLSLGLSDSSSAAAAKMSSKPNPILCTHGRQQ